MTPRILARWWCRAVLAWAGLAGAAGAAGLSVRADAPLTPVVTALSWELDGPFALQRLELVLRNPHGRPLEATVLLPLRADERLKGYALDVDGLLRDAVPVERTQGRVAFEQTVRQRIDPSLAEQDAGNAYRIRVFPVPAGGERRVRIDIASLAERSACGWRHVLQASLPAPLAARVRSRTDPGGRADGSWQPVDGQYQTGLSLPPGESRRTLCLPAPAGDARYTAQLDDGTLLHWLEVPAAPGHRPQPLPGRIELVWDAAYGAPLPDRRAELQWLARYLAGRDVDITLTVLRLQPERRHFRVRGGDAGELIRHLQALQADGAFNLAAWRAEPGVEAVLLFSPLALTWPDEDWQPPAVPLHVVSSGLAHPALARALTRQGGQVLDLAQLDTETALQRLRTAPSRQLRLGPLDERWQAPGLLPQQGALRACHVAAPRPGALPEPAPGLPVEQADAAGRPRVQPHPAGPAQPSAQAAFWCAVWWVEGLEARPQRHRTQLAELGQRLGVPNSETSLIVLEREADYLRHGILPSQASARLREAVLRQRARQAELQAQAAARHRAAIDQGWQARVRWWATDFPQGPRPVPKAAPSVAAEGRAALAERAETASARSDARVSALRPLAGAPPPPAPAAMPAAPAPATAPSADAGPVGMALRAVQVNEPYTAALLASRDPQAVYARYLDLRLRYGSSPAFHYDVADRLYALGAGPLATQVLSNIVALMPREHAALRLVAYRLQQAGQPAQALALLQRVRALAPDEPQSWRDLGLAQARAGACADAMESLLQVVNTPWDMRFADIGLIALAEANDLATRCPADASAGLPPEWRNPLPVGLRVVLRWDLNDTDIDLHVTDPEGETAYYGHRQTWQGGALSRDFTAGYGPEEFVLRRPRPGTYRVQVNYFGSGVAKLVRGATVNVTLQTGFGTPQLQEQTLTLRLLEHAGLVAVGHFEVGTDGALRPAAP